MSPAGFHGGCWCWKGGGISWDKDNEMIEQNLGRVRSGVVRAGVNLFGVDTARSPDRDKHSAPKCRGGGYGSWHLGQLETPERGDRGRA